MGRVTTLRAARRTLADDVLDGLTRPAKELPPKYFYDARGSDLFDRITELPEYYPTRAERAILEARADDIAATTGARELVELGAGTADKTRVLLDTGAIERYVPFDVDGGMVRDTAAALAEEYPGLEVEGITGDFEHDLAEIPPPQPGAPRVVAFLGGTIGNFAPGSRRRFLRELGARLDDDSFLLLGTDLVKDPAVLEAAYNDSQGVTAEFNLNTCCASSTASSTPTSTPATSSTSPSTTRRASGSRCGCAPAAPTRCGWRRSTSTSSSTAARSCGPRSRPSSLASAWRQTSARPGSSSSSG